MTPFSVTFSYRYKDFEQYNLKRAAVYMAHQKKRLNIFGTVELIIAVLFGLYQWALGANKFLSYLWCVILLVLGVFTLLFYPLFFESKLVRSLKNEFENNIYFSKPVTFIFTDKGIIENSAAGKGKVLYADIVSVEEIDTLLIVQLKNKAGYFFSANSIDNKNYQKIKSVLYQQLNGEDKTKEMIN